MPTASDNSNSHGPLIGDGLVAVPLVDLQQPINQTMRPWLSIDEAAEYANLSPATIRRMLQAGKLTAHDPCEGKGRRGKILIDRHQLDAVIRASKAPIRKRRKRKPKLKIRS